MSSTVPFRASDHRESTRPRDGFKNSIACAAWGAALGSLSALAMIAEPISIAIGAQFGAVAGLALSPLTLFGHDRERIRRAISIAGILSVPVAFVSGWSHHVLVNLALSCCAAVVLFLLARISEEGRTSLRWTLLSCSSAGFALVAFQCRQVLPSAGESTETLIALLGANDMEVSHRAGRLLRDTGSPTPFIEALSSSDPGVRGAAARNLGILGVSRPDVIEALVQASNDSDSYVRNWVAFALGRVCTSSDAGCAETLRRLATDSSPTVSNQAREGFRSIQTRDGSVRR